MKLKHALLILLITFLFGCSENNPLLGEWQSKPQKLMGIPMPTQNMTFSKKSMRTGSFVSKVEYEISKNEVIVTDETGIGVAFKLIDPNTISMEMPGLGKSYYNRLN